MESGCDLKESLNSYARDETESDGSRNERFAI